MKHQSYQEYVEAIINHLPAEMELDFVECYRQQLMQFAESRWTEYVSGKTSDYLLSNKDIDRLWKSAHEKSIENSLIKLAKLELVETKINAQGEIVYSVTDKGREYLSELGE